MRIKLILLLTLILNVKSYAQFAMDKIADKVDFEKFSGPPLSDKYGQVTALKVVYDLKSKKLYFINSLYFKYHQEFCYEQLNYEVDLAYFNKMNYSEDPRRRFLLANINYFKSSDTYALEISPVDLMTVDQIHFLHEKVSEVTFFGDDLRFLLNSARLQQARKGIEDHIPIINPEEVYANLKYQAISKYSSYGRLKFIRDLEVEKNNLTPKDIIVLHETPLYLPKVAGIIVTEFQTPLSHLTILGQNRKIPIAAYKLAFEDSLLRGFENKKVSYTVLKDTFKIKQADFIDQPSTRFKEINIKYDLAVNTLVDIGSFNKKSVRYAGNKAANFAILYKLSKKAGFKTPESAFVIPFYFYDKHVASCDAQRMIDNLLSLNTVNMSNDSLRRHLKDIRDEIKRSPVDTTLLNQVIRKIQSEGTYTRMRFRSSTNAEDAKGFSGAGLYTSKTGELYSRDKRIEEAIKKVWASLWSFEAYSEREYFNINHHDVFMAVLVHRSFPDEAVNGVAITKNLYRKDSYGFVVNVQSGNESVVQPSPGVVSDQFICYPDNKDNIYENKNTIDIITLSSLNNGNLVMTVPEIQNLANQLELIKKYFLRHTFGAESYFNFGLDIEFKLDGENRDLYIKQVRFYND